MVEEQVKEFKLNVGQTYEETSTADDFIELPRVKIKDGDNYHRVVNGPLAKTRQVFWSTRVKNQDTGELESKTKVVLLEENSILHRLSRVEKKIREELGEKDPKLVFQPTVRYPYQIFDLSNPKKEIQICDYTKTVYDQFKLIQNKLTQDSAKLANGLIFMYPVIINNTVEKGKSKQRGTRYVVQPNFADAKSKFWAGRVPASWKDFNKEEINRSMNTVKNGKLLWEYVFEKDELDAIIAFQNRGIDFSKIYKPKTDEEVIERFSMFPLDIYGSDMNGRPFFSQPERFMEKFHEYHIKFLESRSSYVQISSGDDGFQTEIVDVKEIANTKKPVQEHINVADDPVPDDLLNDSKDGSDVLDFLNDDSSVKHDEDDLILS